MKKYLKKILIFIMIISGIATIKIQTKSVSAFQATKQRPIKDGIYQIASKIDNGYCLDVFAELSMNDIDIILWTRNPNNNFMKFRFTYLNDGYYKIENIGSNKVMQAVDNSSNCNVQQSGWDESSRQKWKLTLYNDDFVISPKSYPSSCITISSGNVGDLESIKITPFHESNYQKWNIIPL